jgi:hypothetical protein
MLFEQLCPGIFIHFLSSNVVVDTHAEHLQGNSKWSQIETSCVSEIMSLYAATCGLVVSSTSPPLNEHCQVLRKTDSREGILLYHRCTIFESRTLSSNALALFQRHLRLQVYTGQQPIRALPLRYTLPVAPLFDESNFQGFPVCSQERQAQDT